MLVDTAPLGGSSYDIFFAQSTHAFLPESSRGLGHPALLISQGKYGHKVDGAAGHGLRGSTRQQLQRNSDPARTIASVFPVDAQRPEEQSPHATSTLISFSRYPTCPAV